MLKTWFAFTAKLAHTAYIAPPNSETQIPQIRAFVEYIIMETNFKNH